MNNIDKLNKNQCTGCRMCEQICPFDAIKMIENKEGFLEPKIDYEKCTNCGMCYKKCPQINDVNSRRLENIEVYAAKNKNVEEQKASSSGGIFSILANYVLDKNGIVYGCAYNEDLVAEHIRIENKKELYKLRGSKYVQSNTKHTFTEVKEYLKNDKFVLYTGTPCQIAGLKAFLGKDYETLILVDFICHGVPSPLLFKKYIDWLQSKNISKIEEYNFRSKEKNDWGLNSKVKFNNGNTIYIPANLDAYYKSFLDGKTYRECCYKCKYANTQRNSDITIADFWGIQKEYPEFYDEKGVSAIIVNTEKGNNIIKNVENKIEKISTSINQVKKYNSNLQSATKRYEDRENVYIDIENKTFEKYIKENLKYKKEIKDIIKSKVPNKVKKIVKEILK